MRKVRFCTMFETYPEVLTLKQCQQALQIGRSSALQLVQSGELKAFKLKGGWRVRRIDLEAYVKRF